ncbi:hypothetical protein [Mycolicibacterium fortuitum]|uniref:hypothetical protein n=1 Tax=Mycolicibacterium fortuitum TaxID=1766 RepID=UPI0026084F5B|nr:hypothetical protein [Mycolicibacterium fortuitum]
MTDLMDRIGPNRRQLSRQISFTIELDTARIIAAFEAMQESWERMAASLRISGGYMLIRPGSWVIRNDPDRQPEKCSVPDIAIEFGPQNWIHEMRRIPPPALQFPRQWPRLYVSPIEYEVAAHWQQFCAPRFPVPDLPGYDFTRYVPADNSSVWTASPPAPRQASRPATARRTPRRGRSRR